MYLTLEYRCLALQIFSMVFLRECNVNLTLFPYVLADKLLLKGINKGMGAE